MQPKFHFRPCSNLSFFIIVQEKCEQSKVKRDGKKRADGEARYLVHQVEYMMKRQPSLAESAKSVEKREGARRRKRERERESKVG